MYTGISLEITSPIAERAKSGYSKIPILMPTEILIQAAGSSKSETGFRKIAKKSNFPISLNNTIPTFIPRRMANIKGSTKKSPERTLNRRDIEFKENMKKKIFG